MIAHVIFVVIKKGGYQEKRYWTDNGSTIHINGPQIRDVLFLRGYRIGIAVKKRSGQDLNSPMTRMMMMISQIIKKEFSIIMITSSLSTSLSIHVLIIYYMRGERILLVNSSSKRGKHIHSSINIFIAANSRRIGKAWTKTKEQKDNNLNSQKRLSQRWH